MHRQEAERRLKRLGFEIDWSCTGPGESGSGWAGTIDAIGRHMLDGNCRGEVVHGDTAADWYRAAVGAAESYAGKMARCMDASCEFHTDRE